MSEERAQYLLKPCAKGDTLEREQSRRLLARGLDELELEATQFERTLIQWLNQVRAIQGKRPVIVPKG